MFNAKNCTLKTLNKCIKYITNDKKSNQEYIGGIGVDLNSPYEDMVLIKSLHRKLSGRQHIHWMCSYETQNTLELCKVKELATEIAEYFSNGFQMVWATHINTEHYHTHFVVNTVNVYSGRKFSQSQSDLRRLKEFVNMKFAEYAIDLIDDFEIEEVDDDFYDTFLEDFDDTILDEYEGEAINEMLPMQPMVTFEMVGFNNERLLMGKVDLSKPHSMVSFDMVYFE